MTPQRQLIYWLAGLGAILFAFWLLSNVLAPFLIGMAVAYFLDPLCDRLERLGLSRTLATSLVTAFFVIAVALVLALLVPMIVGELASLGKQVPGWIDLLRTRLVELSDMLRTEVDPAILERVRSYVEGLQGQLSSWAAGLLRNVLSGGVALFNVLSLLLITPIVAFYLLRDWDALVSAADRMLPPAYADVIRLQVQKVDETLSGFVRGVGTVCLTLGAFYATALTIAGLDFGLVIGLLAGLVSFVPFVGATLGFIASVGMALLQFDGYIMVFVVAAIFFIGQFVEGNFLQPILVGDRVNLHPVWIIFALLAGGTLLGFVGVLLAVPAAAVIGVAVRFFVNRYRATVLGVGDDPGDPATAARLRATVAGKETT
ncbi:AI-2E family transporter [Rhodovibrio salinarum]|uniref:AI-2E family transporter n=1 Tax=Rhodovibrio salinarum TaxID=1087 RepID=A0A934QIV1_9PROT|nr:AI-2E family transporter [Rhodovibrio salinarum]MBK1697517.1 AI-2E family transporter [Rhodovibrio salinarum]